MSEESQAIQVFVLKPSEGDARKWVLRPAGLSDDEFRTFPRDSVNPLDFAVVQQMAINTLPSIQEGSEFVGVAVVSECEAHIYARVRLEQIFR